MDRAGYVLAVMAAGGDGARYAPVHVQKLFFLMDREASKHTGGPSVKQCLGTRSSTRPAFTACIP